MVKPYVPPPAGNPDFPAMMWHPETGESRLFKKAEDVPGGWIDTHPKNKPSKAAAPAATLTRKEIRGELDEGGIAYDKNASTDALLGILVSAVKEHLDAVEIPYDANADAKALLALVPKPE